MVRGPYRLKVAAKQQAAKDSVIIQLEIPESLKENFLYQPGQYITLGLEFNQAIEYRCYSIVTCPNIDVHIRVLVRRVPGGLVSSKIVDDLNDGDEVFVLPPAGSFILRNESSGQLFLFAGGSGIGPIYSILNSALRMGRRVALFYANRDSESFAFFRDLENIARTNPDLFQLRFWSDQERGIPTIADFCTFIQEFEPSMDSCAEYYMCGPHPFMELVGDALATLKVRPDRIYKEEFSSPPKNSLNPELATNGKLFSASVSLKGKNYAFDVRESEMLLDAMLRHGLPAPHACRAGQCAACLCKVRNGDVQRLENSVVDASDEDKGWCAACRTLAMSDSLDIVFM